MYPRSAHRPRCHKFHSQCQSGSVFRSQFSKCWLFTHCRKATFHNILLSNFSIILLFNFLLYYNDWIDGWMMMGIIILIIFYYYYYF